MKIAVGFMDANSLDPIKAHGVGRLTQMKADDVTQAAEFIELDQLNA